MSTGKDWIVLTAKPSTRSGLHIHGINLNHPEDSPDRHFYWEISWESIDNDRYDWTRCKYAEGSDARIAQLRAIANARHSGRC